MKKRNLYVGNIPLAEARCRWFDALTADGCLGPLVPETVAVDDSLGRITAEPVFAVSSSPFYNGAAMDGIAVRFAETLGAGDATPVVLFRGKQFAYVNTGNCLPPGFDAVIMIEDVHPLDENRVEIIGPATPWQHVRTIGEDIVATELLLPAGHDIRPIDLGAMLATGVNTVSVRPRPRVLVIPTGSELVQPGEPVAPGNIIEFNSRILAGYLTQWGAAPARAGCVPDDPRALEDILKKSVPEYDLVVINAGASAGTEDHTLRVLERLGRVIVHGVNIKPGKPVILAIVQGKPVVGLPGYPVSAVLTMDLFVRQMIAEMVGTTVPAGNSISAVLARPLSSKMGVEEFVRVKLGRVGERLIVTPSGRGAGAVMSLVQADGILTVPAGSEGIGAGEKVDVRLLRGEDEINNTLVFIGSHDNLLDLLADLLHQQRPMVRLSSAHVGSMGGIMAIKRGEAHLAGTHLLDEKSGEYNVPFIRKYLGGIPLILVNLAFREQGLLVPRGNPKNIRGFPDLARDGIRFINRQRGAGTRLLTDMHLNRLGISPDRVAGYGREEYTHMNVASAISTGSADTGLAIRAAARALDLDFIPVAEERYDLIVPKAFVDEAKVRALLDILRAPAVLRRAVDRLGGYDLKNCGDVVYEQ